MKVTQPISVETQNLSKVYQAGQEVRALKGIGLQVPAGEFLAITGPSGSGKSTLLNLIGALDQPTEGTVCVGGIEITTLKDNPLADFRRENIGFIFQLFHLVPVLNALENVMLPLLPYPRRGFDLKARARELLDEVGLAGREQHLPSQLSGGEQQRVAIARALINTPGLLLADEPTGNLDSQAGAEIVALLRRMNRERGLTVLLVTHDPAVAKQADRVIRLVDGRLVDPGAVNSSL